MADDPQVLAQAILQAMQRYQAGSAIPYGPGSTLPGVPTMSGFAPTVSGYANNLNAMYAGNQQALALMASDPRAQFATAMLAQTQGVNADRFMGSTAGRLTELGLAAAINGPMAGMMGGSRMDMFFGLQHAVASSGAQIGGGIIAGGGASTDLFTNKLFTELEQNYFNRVTGASNTYKTQGFNRSQIGQLVGALGDQGAFRGMGKDSSINFDDAGKLQLNLSGADSSKFDKTIGEALKLMRFVKDVTGSDNTREMLKLAQELTGMNINVSGAGSIQSALQRLKDVGARYGIDTQTMFGMQQDSIRTGMSMGLSGQLSAALGLETKLGTVASANTNADVSAARAGAGYGTQQISLADASRRDAVNAASVAQGDITLKAIAAVKSIPEFRLSDAQKTEFDAAAEAYARAGTAAEKSAALVRLNRAGGAQFQEARVNMADPATASMLMANLGDAGNKWLAHGAASRVDALKDVMAQNLMGHFAEYQHTDKKTKALLDASYGAKSNLSSKALAAVSLGLLNGDVSGAFHDIYNDPNATKETLQQAADLDKALAAMSPAQREAYAKLSNRRGEVNTQVGVNTAGDLMERDNVDIGNYMRDHVYGNDTAITSIVGQLGAGLSGGALTDRGAVARAMNLDRKTGSKSVITAHGNLHNKKGDDGGGLTFDADQKESVEALVKEMRANGISTYKDAADFEDKVRTQKGLVEWQRAMDEKGIGRDIDNNGNITVLKGGKKALEDQKKAGQKEIEWDLAKQMFGDDYAKVVKGSAAERAKALTSDSAQKFIADAAMGKNASGRNELIAAAQANPGEYADALRKAKESAQKELNDAQHLRRDSLLKLANPYDMLTGRWDKVASNAANAIDPNGAIEAAQKKLDAIKQLQKEAQKGGQSGGGQYLGILRLQDPDGNPLATVDLSRTGALD